MVINTKNRPDTQRELTGVSNNHPHTTSLYISKSCFNYLPTKQPVGSKLLIGS
jgi:hypothetical protein